MYITTPKNYTYYCDKLYELYNSIIQSGVLNTDVKFVGIASHQIVLNFD